MVLSADRRIYSVRDIAFARRCKPDTFFTDLLRRYPLEVRGVIDTIGQALREPFDHREAIDRLAAPGLPGFAAMAAELG